MLNNVLYALSTYIPNHIAHAINLKHDKAKERVYVVGNGWASYYFVKNLNKFKYEPVIIAPNTKVLNTPKLVKRVINPMENVEFANPYALIINDTLDDIDLETNQLITKSGSKYNYKHLVLAIGSEPNDFNIPGVNEHTYKFKTIEDADRLRTYLESPNILSRVYVIGSGVSGIELTCAMSKLKDFAQYNFKLIDGLDKILPGFDDKTINVIKNKIDHTYPSVEIILNSMVKSIRLCGNELEFDCVEINKDNNLRTYNLYPDDIIIWTGGVRFNGYGKTKLFHKLNSLSSSSTIKPRGLSVEPNFSLKAQAQITNITQEKQEKKEEQNSIYCLGDMVANMGPPTAQNAKNQAIWLARYFNSDFDSEYIKSNPYKIESKGKLIHLGSKAYLESKYYSGFVPSFIVKVIELLD